MTGRVISFLAIVFLIFGTPLFSQGQDTAFVLPGIEITESRLFINEIGSHKIIIDSIQLNTVYSMAELLLRHTNVYIKSYGAGGLATTSIRGSGAAQTAVIWNGIPVTNPMVGQTDLALLSPLAVDRIEVLFGSSSTSTGSGAIGGSLIFKNLAKYNTNTRVILSNQWGSFGLWQPAVKAVYGGNKIAGSTKMIHFQAHNRFPYQINGKMPVVKQSNAHVDQTGVAQDMFLKIKPNVELRAHLWWQKSNRDIPPTTTQKESKATQKDEGIRSVVQSTIIGKKTVWQTKAGLVHEKNQFRDDLIKLSNLHEYRQITYELEMERKIWNQNQVKIGFQQWHARAHSDAYDATNRRNSSALFGAFHWHTSILQGQISFRQESIDKDFSPFIPGIGFKMPLANWIQVRGKIYRNFRYPSLNDLFWVPGGDTSLKPEKGWSEELGFTIIRESPNQPLYVEWTSTLYNRKIKNWILWTPTSHSAIWSPQNIALVWSRGIETQFSIFSKSSKLFWKSKIGYDFTLSTHEEGLELPRIEVGDQLWYVPKHQLFTGLTFQLSSWHFIFSHKYTGEVSGLSGPLKPYHYSTLSIGKNFLLGGYEFQISGLLDNIWNTQYEVIERRPMPGRNGKISFSMTLQSGKS